MIVDLGRASLLPSAISSRLTARAEALDPEDIRSLLSGYHERVRSELERHDQDARRHSRDEYEQRRRWEAWRGGPRLTRRQGGSDADPLASCGHWSASALTPTSAETGGPRALQLGSASSLRCLRQPLRLGKNHPRRAPRQLRLELPSRVLRVQRHRDRTRAPRPDHADEEVEAVCRHERDAVARPHLQALLQRTRNVGRLLPEPLVRDRSAAQLGCGRRGSVPLDGALDQCRERLRLLSVDAEAVALDDVGCVSRPQGHGRVLAHD
jgi:hypothetical protein